MTADTTHSTVVSADLGMPKQCLSHSIEASAELQTVSSIKYSTLKLLPDAKDMR